MNPGEARFEFRTAPRILFGPGTLAEAGVIARSFGSRFLVVTGRRPERAQRLLALLEEQGLDAVNFAVPGEPEVSTVREGLAAGRRGRCDGVMAMGGGSAIDAGKAIAAMLANDGDVLDYVEIIGKGRPLERHSAPFIAIPTTAGTGSEVTRNAVLASPEARLKVSLRSPLMLPAVAIVDPHLTLGLPSEITAFTGLDALTQLIEPFVCLRSNPMTDALCREGIPRVARSLERAFRNGTDLAARTDMSAASLFGGMALANAGLGAVHGLAGPLGGMFPAPHGALCAALLPHAIEVNLTALRQRQPSSPALARYDEIARMVTGTADAVAGDGVDWIRRLIGELKVPGLRALGIPGLSPEIVAKAAVASSMKANPIVLTSQELATILEESF